MAKKMVYFFGGGRAEGSAKMRETLGGKGANLAEMTNLGVPVPPGFTITCSACADYYQSGGKWPPGLARQVEQNVTRLEKTMNAHFGDPENPLMVSVRSGAAVSMPGMMDTVLNLGLNDKVIESLIKKTQNPRFAYDSYRRFIDMFGDVVMSCGHEPFEHAIETLKKKVGARQDTDLTADHLKELVKQYKAVYKKRVGALFPQDPRKQLQLSINAVFGSWNAPRAVKYRQLNNITGLKGTAVNVQAMVFGNMGDDCGTGVCFTRNPSSGKKEYYGEFLMNAQGEDVVAGIRTPLPMIKLNRINPQIYRQLTGLMDKLERHYKDMQDIEFTIQKNRLYLLQTRHGKRTAEAEVRIAVDMVKEKLISKAEAVKRVEPEQIDQLLHPSLDVRAKRQVIARGLPASPGAAVGQVVFDAETAEAWKKAGKTVILVRIETSPEDIGGMDAAMGILTQRGGMTSHAAVVARGMGRCCVAGVSELEISYPKHLMKVAGRVVKQGDWISLDGTKGEVLSGQLPLVEPQLSGNFGKLMKWADQIRRLGVRTNADTPEDSVRARSFGAEGIGLCRTEHMFFEGDRIWAVRQMILSAEAYADLRDKIAAYDTEDLTDQQKRELADLKRQFKIPQKEFEGALKTLLPYQRKDFVGIFTAMAGLPVTIRLLDPPLHEFLPQDEKSQKEMARRLGVKPAEVRAKVEELHEMNPMLGHRGCRLTITYPEIARMQGRAIMEAAIEVSKKGKKVLPEIMIPLVGTVKELSYVKEHLVDEINRVFKEKKLRLPYLVGTMIEVPRAALTADEIATEAEFFSYGTNDLTQMACGFSRDDAGKFLGDYVQLDIYDADPFQSLDQTGVGKLVEMGIELGRKRLPKLKVGICGEHGGDPKSIGFCHRVGMNYVSCSPFRVPIARLAAAHAALTEKK
ncbi:MAG: pyruvate phosphate dikinase [Phycisphaerae bacterium SM23_30]|nr:MAG: pyruvate phosphate dikinase [Phycisphaerae bacterium SM23_30]